MYANGKEVRPEGPHGDDPDHYQQISRVYNLNVSPSETNLALVVRTHLLFLSAIRRYTNFFADRTFAAGQSRRPGPAAGNVGAHSTVRAHSTGGDRDPATVSGARFCWLFISRRRDTRSICGWRCMSWCWPHLAFVELAGSTRAHRYPLVCGDHDAAGADLRLLLLRVSNSLPCAEETLVHQAGCGTTAPALLFLGPLLLTVGHSASLGSCTLSCAGFLRIFWFLGWLLFIFLTLIIATVKRNIEAGLLLIPLVLDLVGSPSRS